MSESLYGPQTQLAVQNFPISGQRMPREFLRALGMIKGAAGHWTVRVQFFRYAGTVNFRVQKQ